MKKILYILLLSGTAAFSQASNKPELARKLCNQFLTGAAERGIEVRNRLRTVDKILFLKGENSHTHHGGECTIRIAPQPAYGGEQRVISWSIKRKFLHEIGHHYGLHDCRHCTYNIMAAFQTGRSVFLFEDEAVRRLYIDLFFEQLRNPSLPHKHY